MIEFAAVTIIVLVAGVGILSYLYESMDTIDRIRFSDKMRALGDAVKHARTWRVK